MVREKTGLFLAFLLIIAITLRVYPGLDRINFTYDQARDAFMAQEIINGHLKIVGPSTDIPGVFHGPLFYYFLAPLYLLNDPQIAAVGIILVNLLSLFPLYLLAKDMVKSRFWAIMAMVLFSVSYEAVHYARWISNPSLVLPAYIFYLLGLWRKNWIMIALGLGIAIQAQLFTLYLIPVTVLYAMFFKIPFRFKSLLAGLAIFGLFMSTFLISEIKFGFQGSSGLKNYLLRPVSKQDQVARRLGNYFQSLSRTFQNNL